MKGDKFMSKPGWDLEGMKAMSKFEVETYHNNNGANARINSALHHTIRDSINMRKEWAENHIAEARDKKREISKKREEILEGYSYSDRQKGKFSRFDNKKLQELAAEDTRLNETIAHEEKSIKDLEVGGSEIFSAIEDMRNVAETSLMFGYPRDPRLQSSRTNDIDARDAEDKSKLDFTKSDDRVRNYQHQEAWAKNLVVLAELLGPKVAKDIYHLFDVEMGMTTRQPYDAIDAKKEALQSLLSKHGFSHLHTEEYRLDRGDSRRIEDRPTTEMAVSAIASNSHNILRLATQDVVHMFLEWPEEDKRALKEKSKEPDYANQVCRAIDNVLHSMGGIQGMEVPADLIAKLEKLKAPYAKMVSKQTSEQRQQFEHALDVKEGKAFEQNNEPVEISMKARELYERWRKTGSGLEFFPWCSENMPYEEYKDISQAEFDALSAEEAEGVRQYHEQERARQEERRNTISPEARHWFELWQNRPDAYGYEFDAYMSKMLEEGQISAEEYNQITGVEKLMAERDKGMQEYQEQQAKQAEALVGTIDPTAYTYYDAYSKSGSPLEFVKWCDEKGLEVPRGWEKVQEERLAGQREYQEQQAKLAEERANSTVIDPRAYAYYDAYSKSGSPLGFVKWCDEKGLEVPSGWQKIEQERLAGQQQYQQQQSAMENEDEGMEM